MADTALHLALREWRRQLLSPTGLGIAAGIAAILALAGPFGTHALLPLVPRFLYWFALTCLTYSIGVLVGASVEIAYGSRLRVWQLVGIVGAATGLGATGVVLGLNLGFFDYWPNGAEFLNLFATIMVISVIVTAMLQVLDQSRGATDAPAPEAPDLPPILDRMDFEKRGRLVALSVEDHYVRIRTHRGEVVLLMRLSDAMREVGTTPGLQVHRSHWVALAEITGVRREKDRAILTMSTGPEIPVSRANVPKLREAGLLPK